MPKKTKSTEKAKAPTEAVFDGEEVAAVILEGQEPQPPQLPKYEIGEASAGLVAVSQMTDDEFEQQLVHVKMIVNRINRITQELLQPEIDYGTVPGIKKPCLFQEGAITICRVFKFAQTFKRKITYGDGTSAPHVTVESECFLHLGTAAGPIVGSAGGACTSWEKKYRYRTADLGCPECGSTGTLLKSKFPPKHDRSLPPGWYCFAKRGGCGAEFLNNDPRITEQERGIIENPDPLDQLETIVQMADKRALVMATRRTTGAGRLFTQDEDILQDSGPAGPPVSDAPAPAPAARPAPPPQQPPAGKPRASSVRQPGGPPPEPWDEPQDEPQAKPKASGAVQPPKKQQADSPYIPPIDELRYLEAVLDSEATNELGNDDRVFNDIERRKLLQCVSGIRVGPTDKQPNSGRDTFLRYVVRTVTEYRRRTGNPFPTQAPKDVVSYSLQLLEDAEVPDDQ